jgi:anti-sigma-K factor RskA
MAGTQEHWRQHSEIYALGALDGHELEEYESHLASNCAICQARLRETREVLNLLYRSLRPLAPPARLKARLFDQIARERVVSISRPEANQAPRWRMLSGMIAAGVAGVMISGIYYTRRYEPRHSVYTSVINLLRDPATRDYILYGAGPALNAQGRFLWNESGEGHIFVSNLPAAPQGKMYAVWTIAQAVPRYVGTITTDGAGQGGLHIISARSDRAVEIFAVTLEPAGSTAAPTGPIVLASKHF